MPGIETGETRVVVAPDKLRGTLSASRAADALAGAVAAAGGEPDPCPLSDGGEGFLDVLAVLGGEERTTMVTGPLGAPVRARWRLAGGRAVVESAAASGLVLAGGRTGNRPVEATSRGTGELLVAALSAGAREILVGVGGSAMTDGGRGALEALEESGGIRDAEVVVACDVRTTFLDAAEQFGPQKGASPSQVSVLRRQLERSAAQYRRRYGVDVLSLPGGGAAGGLAGGLAAAGARLVPGFGLVAGAVGLERRMVGARLVLGAEGRLDAGTWTGKVVAGLADMAGRLGVPLAVLAGSADPAGRAEAKRRQVELVVLEDLFGPARARSSAAQCLSEGARELVRARLTGPIDKPDRPARSTGPIDRPDRPVARSLGVLGADQGLTAAPARHSAARSTSVA